MSDITKNISAIKSMYDRLADDESRLIFETRLLFSLNGNPDPFYEKVANPFFAAHGLDKVVEKLRQIRANGTKIVCWGAGIFGRQLLPLLRYHGLFPDCIADRDTTKRLTGSWEFDVPLITPDELFEKYGDAAVIIGTSRFLDEIRDTLLKRGFKPEMIFDEFAIINNLSEEKSTYTHLLKPVPDEIYVDGGVLDASSIRGFIEFCGGKHQKVYGFEPDPDSYKHSVEIIKQEGLERVEMIGKGLWSSTTTLAFSNRNDGASKINEAGEIKIDVTSIDETVGDDKVTFIKMDIEGAELEALKGAVKTITRHKPRLAICVYHKPEDILEIPLYVHSLVPEYTLYLRHESLDTDETVLYAMVEQ